MYSSPFPPWCRLAAPLCNLAVPLLFVLFIGSTGARICGSPSCKKRAKGSVTHPIARQRATLYLAVRHSQCRYSRRTGGIGNSTIFFIPSFYIILQIVVFLPNEGYTVDLFALHGTAGVASFLELGHHLLRIDHWRNGTTWSTSMVPQ